MGLSRRSFLIAIGALGAAGGSGLAAWHYGDAWESEAAKLHTQTSHALGTKVSISVAHSDAHAASTAIGAAFAEIEVVEQVLSIYRKESQLSRLNREGWLANPHAYFLQVMRAAEALSKQTGGAFDVTVQPLWELFAEAAAEGGMPTEQAIEQVQRRVGWGQLSLNESEVRLANGAKITANGIAQGFALDAAMAAIQQAGIEHALIDTGELAGFGLNEKQQPWRVGIQHPRRTDAFASVIEPGQRCLATSGDYQTAFSADGKYNHLFDPRNPRGVSDLASVSVLAPTGLLADGLSTAVFVLGAEQGARLLAETPDVDALLITRSGRTLTTAGFPGEVV